jgi:hypothetical protein
MLFLLKKGKLIMENIEEIKLSKYHNLKYFFIIMNDMKLAKILMNNI